MQLVKDKIPKLYRSLAIPVSVGFFFQTMYNVVDSFYAGQLGEDGLAALGISFPVFFIFIALGSGIGQGITALIGQALGANDKKQAKRYVMKGISFSLLLSVVLTILGFIFAKSIFQFLGAEGQYLEYTLQYLYVVIGGLFTFLLMNVLNAILQAQGDTKSFRNVLIVGFFLNLILNPIFMNGWFGLPALGIAGIALATILIHVVKIVYLFHKVSQTPVFEEVSWINLRPRLDIYKEIVEQGLPASLSMLTVALGMFIYNFFLSGFGSEYIAAYNTGLRIEQIFLLPSIGLNIACLTLVAQNAGAKKWERVKEIYYVGLKYGIYVAVFSLVGITLLKTVLMDLFTDNPQVIEYGAYYLQIAAFLTMTYIIMFLTVSLYQGLKKPKFGLWIGAIRQLLLPLVIIPITVAIFGAYGVWYAVAGIVTSMSIVTLIIGLRKVRNLN